MKSTEILGALFGKEERAREIIGFYREHISAVTDLSLIHIWYAKRRSMFLRSSSWDALTG